MNPRLARAWFIPLALTLDLVLTVLAATRFADQPGLAWMGALVACAVLPVFMGYLMLARPARTAAGLPWWVLIGMAGSALSLTGYGSALVGLAGAAVMGAYVYWYSPLDRTESCLKLDHPLPDFTLTGLDGTTVERDDFLGRRWLFLFYRGNWCPLCMAQVQEVAARYRELEGLGVNVALVSPQPSPHTRRLAESFNVKLTFYRDPGGQAARALGIFARDGVPRGLELLGYDSDTVLPTVVMTDEAGRIVFLDETDNYRVRPEPETFLAIARERFGAKA